MEYDPSTGVLSWIVNKGSAGKGKVSETKSFYITHQVDYKEYKATHLIWLYVYGYLPTMIIDHINGNIADNRLENLREVTLIQNNRNAAKKSNTSSRFRGVSKKGYHKWRVMIRTDVKHLYIGEFYDECEAAFRYDMASIIYHQDFGRRNFLPLVT